jgi:hypothetical protein
MHTKQEYIMIQHVHTKHRSHWQYGLYVTNNAYNRPQTVRTKHCVQQAPDCTYQTLRTTGSRLYVPNTAYNRLQTVRTKHCVQQAPDCTYKTMRTAGSRLYVPNIAYMAVQSVHTDLHADGLPVTNVALCIRIKPGDVMF